MEIEFVWCLLILAIMVVYPVILVRSALRGRQWAIDTLEAMRYVGGDLMTTSSWLALPPERSETRPVDEAERTLIA